MTDSFKIIPDDSFGLRNRLKYVPNLRLVQCRPHKA